MKPFKSLTEQIEILKLRGISFKNEFDAKNYLLHNNYYNVINCYGKFFITNNKYKTNTSFENICDIHHFDKEVKNYLLKAIIEAEKTFKSILSYRYAEFIPNSPYPYYDTKNYNTQNININKLIDDLKKIISKKSKTVTAKATNSIAHYVSKHHNVPIWVLTNYMTFGQLSFFYSCLQDKLKATIAKDMLYFLEDNYTNINKTQLTSSDLESYISNIVEIRNIIAHNNKLLDYKCKRSTRYHDIFYKKYNITQSVSRQSVFDVYVVLSCFLTRNQYEQLTAGLKKRIKKLQSKIDSEVSEKIINSLGFPKSFIGDRLMPHEESQ